MDVKEYEDPTLQTIVFMEGEQVEESENIETQQVEYANVEIQNENIESSEINEDDSNKCQEELVIDGALENIQQDDGSSCKVEEVEYKDATSQEQWIQQVAGVNPENIEVRTDEEGNVEYYAIPTTDGQYFAVPNHVLKEEGIALDQATADAECLMSSIVNNENGNVIVHENIDGSNIQYFEMPQIIQNEENNLLNEEQQEQLRAIATNSSGENGEESTIIVHLGNNLTIDEKGQIHSSASEYFPVGADGDGDDGEQMETAEVEFYDETTEEICGDQMIISEQDQHEEGKKLLKNILPQLLSPLHTIKVIQTWCF